MSEIKIIGHRGARGLAPENTAASIKKALVHHVDEVEIDVRVTKDHIPIVLHNRSLLDPSGNCLPIKKHGYAELKVHRPDLLTLTEAIVLVKQKVPMVIEVKPHEPTGCIITVVRELMKKGLKPESIRFASFSLKTLKALHKAFPEVCIVVNDPFSGVRATHRARKFKTKRIAMNERWLWSGFIRSMQRGGYELSAYTLNDAARTAKFAKYGLFAVVTDFPDRFE